MLCDLNTAVICAIQSAYQQRNKGSEYLEQLGFKTENLKLGSEENELKGPVMNCFRLLHDKIMFS